SLQCRLRQVEKRGADRFRIVRFLRIEPAKPCKPFHRIRQDVVRRKGYRSRPPAIAAPAHSYSSRILRKLPWRLLSIIRHWPRVMHAPCPLRLTFPQFPYQLAALPHESGQLLAFGDCLLRPSPVSVVCRG